MYVYKMCLIEAILYFAYYFRSILLISQYNILTASFSQN